MTNGNDIESPQPTGVKSLRSRFEYISTESPTSARSPKAAGTHTPSSKQAGIPAPPSDAHHPSSRVTSGKIEHLIASSSPSPASHHLRQPSYNNHPSPDPKSRPPPPPPPPLPHISHPREPSSDGPPSPDPKSRRPPPPPPPGARGSAKKPPPAVLASPLLRPVPSPSPNLALGSPSLADTLSPRSDSYFETHNSGDELPRAVSVASLRDRFSQPPNSSPPRSITPKPAPVVHVQPPSSQSEPLLSLIPPIPPRHTKPEPSRILPSNIVESPQDVRPRKAPTPPPHPRRTASPSPFSEDESDGSVSMNNHRSRPVPPPKRPRPSESNLHHQHLSGYQGSTESFSSNDSISSLSSSPNPPPKPPARLHLQPPPPPPPSRHDGHHHHANGSTSQHATDSSSSDYASSSTPVSSTAPPLPIRRISPSSSMPEITSPPPPLPTRHSINISGIPDNMGSPIPERKPLGGNKLPPPPTRTIGLGEKLPPMRRAQSPSSDEESEEDDPRLRAVEMMPDASRSSRRPPHANYFQYLDYKIHVPAYSGHAAVAGSRVLVTTPHHIRYYDLSISEVYLWSADMKELGMRDMKVTAMEFAPPGYGADGGEEPGSVVWLGMKEGHLVEFAIKTRSVLATKLGAHAHAVTHIFRHGRAMVSLDDGGKALVFEPPPSQNPVLAMAPSLAMTPPRVVRTAEKQEFAALVCGLLWMSARGDTANVAGGAGGPGGSAVPVIRVYDVFAPGNIGRSVLPTQHAGAVMCGTTMQSQPGVVFLGHEGGYISAWDISQDGDGMEGATPTCMEVMKVGSSDVLCLAGVADKLWAGGRKGVIMAYDVSQKPWVVTNAWVAHKDLPVLRMWVDPYSIEKVERLSVVSVGRDEQLRIWDGMLGVDWVDQELLKREKSFNSFRNLSILVVSWNVDAAKPDALTGNEKNLSFLSDVLSSVDSPDIISFGFQEVIDLESRKMAAKTVLLGGKKKGEDGRISEKVTTSYRRWHDRLVLAVQLAMPAECPYTVIHTESLVGLFTCIFAKNTEKVVMKDTAVASIKRGMGGRYGNKGGIVARFVVDDTSICMINCHLAAGQHHVQQRNADVAGMLEEKDVFPSARVFEDPIAYVGGGDGSMVLDHEIVIVNGDMNYRIDQRREPVVAAIHSGEWEALLAHDQLAKEMRFNRAFRFRTFNEGPLAFAPTYKYDRGSDEFDTSEKRRVPAWCDRVLWRSREPERVVQTHYRRWEPNISDHRPISAGFVVTIKSVDADKRRRAKREVEKMWDARQVELLHKTRDWYFLQAMIV